MSPGQIIHLKSHDGKDCYWYVESVCYGGLGQESVIHVSRCDGVKKPDCLGKERAMFVPALMIEKLIETCLAKVYDKFEGHQHELTE